MKLETLFDKLDLFADAPDAVSRIRDLMLGLAFSGRLTVAGKGNIDTSVKWERRTIESICSSITPGFACSRNHTVEGGHVHLRTHNISTLGSLNFDLLLRIDPKMVDRQKASIRKGDILFNNTNSQELVGKTALVDRDYDFGFSNHITRLRLIDEVSPGFVVLYLTLLRNSGYFAKICTRWINQAAVNTDTLKKETILLPPLAEQKRIVAKVDELMTLCDRLEEQQQERETKRVALTRASIARFAEAPTVANLNFLFPKSYAIDPASLRKSILTLAVQGKLVRRDPNDVPGADVLKRIEAARCRDAVAEPIDAVDKSEEPFSIPSSWKWVRLANIAKIKHGYAFNSQSFTRAATPFVLTTPGNFFETGGFRDRGANTKYYNGEVPSGFVFKPGDLIVPMTEQAAGLLGSPAFIPDDGRTYLHNQRLGKLEFYSDEVASEFVFWFFNTEFFRGELARTCTGMKVRHTSPKRILKVPFPLCSFAEQCRIVAKVEQLMALVDELETQLSTSRATGEKLLEAFVAELASGGSRAAPSNIEALAPA
jgi:type I restriction enzyme S subunit